MNIGVALPVGPSLGNRRWLSECIDSILAQTRKPAHVVVVDDQAELDGELLEDRFLSAGIFITHYRTPWRSGVAHAFNFGVALCRANLVFMLGSDDVLDPECLELTLHEHQKHADDLGYYYTGVRYMDTGETQTCPCNAAAVTPALWRHCGGFPVETASGAPDAALVSTFMLHPDAGRLWPVADGKPLYNYRRHNGTDTAGRAPWQGVILETRNIVARDWKPCTR